MCQTIHDENLINMPAYRCLVFCYCFGCLGFFPSRAWSAQKSEPAPTRTTEVESAASQVSPATRLKKGQLRTLVTFSAMGDVPRKQAEEWQLVRQLAELPAGIEFVVHLGDIKSGGTPCDARTYLKVAGLLATSRVPVLIIPGDNEWNDCPQPDCAWRLWQKYFSHFERYWKLKFTLTRPSQRDELFSFVQGNVLFLGLNLVGGRVHDSLAWKMRHTDDIEWTRLNFHHFGSRVKRVVVLGHARPTGNHADYFAALVQEAQQFGRPVLYLHGDGHRWYQRHPWKAENLQDVQVDQGGIAPPVTIAVTDDDSQPFVFDRRLPGDREQ